MKSKMDNEILLRQTIQESTCLIEVIRKFNLRVNDETFLRLRKLIQKYNISTDHFGGVSSNSRWSKTNIIHAVEGSTSYREVLRKLKVGVFGSNHKTLKKYLGLYNINFIPSANHNNNVKFYKAQRNSLESVLTKNSSYSRVSLKRRLIKEQIMDYMCARCGNPGEWLNQPIVLQLEHKNGVANDNRLENLEFLCPNCHSQTKTFAGKNISNQTPKETHENKS